MTSEIAELVFETIDVAGGEAAGKALRALPPDERDAVWADLLRERHMTDLARAFGLTHVLPVSGGPRRRGTGSVALLAHLYYPELFEHQVALMRSLPPDADIYVTTDDADKKARVLELTADLPNAVEARLVENRGRSEAALLVGLADVPARYDVLCFLKEKLSRHASSQAAGSWAYEIEHNLLATSDYVESVLALFEAEPRLGLAVPPMPVYAGWGTLPGLEWTNSFGVTATLHGTLDLGSPISFEKAPVCPFGGAFWFRGAALAKLFGHGWRYEDFPEEPLALDGTLLHAIERIYPFVAQDAGFYTATVVADDYAGVERANLFELAGSVNALFRGEPWPRFPNHTALLAHLRAALDALDAAEVAAKAAEEAAQAKPEPQLSPLTKAIRGLFAG